MAPRHITTANAWQPRSVQTEQGRENLRVLCPPASLTANGIGFLKSSDGTLGVEGEVAPPRPAPDRLSVSLVFVPLSPPSSLLGSLFF